jgi:uncharacterized membrane protein YphA (DoxX/SURF4 family)
MFKSFAITARVFMGLIFFIVGMNNYFHFFSIPLPGPRGLLFIQALMQSGYFWGFLKATEIVCGVLLLSGLFVPLALVVLAPIVIQICLFHAFLDPHGAPVGFVLLGSELFLLWFYRRNYQGILRIKAEY